MPFHNVSFVTEDGISLSGWYCPQTAGGEPSKRLIVCCNPYNHDRSSLLGISRGLWEASYSVFLFNFRSHAHVPTRQTAGHLEQLDARAALSWVRAHKPAECRVGFVGASMGGAVSLMMAEECDDIAAVASDCAFSTLYDVVRHVVVLRLPALASLPLACDAIMGLINATNRLWYGYDLRLVGPAAVDPATGTSALQRLKCPLFLIHSENDSVVPVSSALAIYNGAATPADAKELLVLPDVEHIGSYFGDESVYVKRFVRFLDNAFDRLEKDDKKEKDESASNSAPTPTPAPAPSLN